MEKSYLKLKIKDIIPYDKNPRINKNAIEPVIKSITESGYISPVIVDENNIILAGHTRALALKKMGVKEIDVVQVTGLTEQQKKEYRVRDNKTTEFAGWDLDILSAEFSTDQLIDLGFDVIKGLDITVGDIDSLADGLDKKAKNKADYEKRLDAENTQKEIYSCDNKFDIPTLEPQDIKIKELMGFNYAKTTAETGEVDSPASKTIHFFLDDYQFDRLWRQPDEYIELLKKYNGILSPDFSLFMDCPIALQIYNTYRNRWAARYYQDQGIKVIPTIGWSDKRSYEFCFLGVKPSTSVAVSTVGVMKNKESQKIFKDGYNKMLETLNPKNILIYGSEIDGLEGNIKYFESRKFGGK